MNDIKLLQDYKTLDGKGIFARRFIGEGIDFASIFFSDFQIARALKTKIFFIDGTFKVPNAFRQVLSILGFCEDTSGYVPLVHILLNSKRQSNYELALMQWKQYIQHYDPSFQPLCFTSDFEVSEIKAIKKIFKCDIVGDSFHFSKALFRKAKKLGLASKVNKNHNILS